MRSKPVKFLILITAILGLSLSAIAACACTHHQPEARSETLSCHSSTHEEPQAEAIEAVPTGDSVSSDCECVMPIVTPAIVVKNESKRLPSGAMDPVENASNPSFELRALASEEDGGFSFTGRQFYRRPFSRSGPSRAPPRL